MEKNRAELNQHEFGFADVIISILKKRKIILVSAAIGLVAGFLMLVLKDKKKEFIRFSVEMSNAQNVYPNEMRFLSNILSQAESVAVLNQNEVEIGGADSQFPDGSNKVLAYFISPDLKNHLQIKANCILANIDDCSKHLEIALNSLIEIRNAEYNRAVVEPAQTLHSIQERKSVLLFRMSELIAKQSNINELKISILALLMNDIGQRNSPFMNLAEAVVPSPEKNSLLTEFRELTAKWDIIQREIQDSKKTAWLAEDYEISPVTVVNISKIAAPGPRIKPTEILFLFFFMGIGILIALFIDLIVEFWRKNFDRIRLALVSK